ncbi:transglycosylase SLT domain-containing protein [Variovorax sp. PAMC28562]|uniref:transglycosylase SLT domain-containing protein n=1 Tax=Variovorax sp. PAMC28562 TaxID=2762323 RepID=UPI00164DCE4B|nr:transglycosylase SLT domain-containing protein [Variovorax sp. PAMC28562]QNK74203.1 transglycosylase SLT domain-containing protein [Variovorax sp. PAMC28562]
MEIFNSLESQYGLPAGLLDSVWSAESARGRNMVSPAGAQGHFQFMPGTAQQYGVTNPNDLTQSATGAARMFSDLLKSTGGDVTKALAGYNWGIGNVQRKGLEAAPTETRNYIQKVTAGMGQPQADSNSSEWDALAQKFAPQTAARTGASGADPWADLNAQFTQPMATAGAQPSRAASKEAAASNSMLDNAASVITNLAPFGTLINAARGPGMERDAAKGFASGFADVGNTLLNGGARLADAVGLGVKDPSQSTLGRMGITPPLSSNDDRQASLSAFNKENDSLAFGGGRFAGNIAATWPVGGTIGAGIRGAAALPMLARAAPALDALGTSIASGGMSTGLAPATLLGQAGNLGLRSAGGAINGYASAGLVDPSSAGLGAVVGGALPPVVAGLGKAGSLAASGVRKMLTPEEVRAAQTVMAAGGYKTPEEIAAVRAALGQQGPNIVGEGPTVPQILQNPGVSQLQRTLRNSGDSAILGRETAQDAARLATLDRVSPVSGTVQQSAENFGNGLSAAVRPAEAQASKEVNQAFNAVDPFDETRFNLPLDEMQAAKDKFLGAGTFGTGGKVDAALAEARRIGTETVPAIVPTGAPGARSQPQNIAQAVRALGGINTGAVSSRGLAGELADLRQSGLGSIMQNGRGQSIDTLAQAMHAQGFIPEADSATLLNALRDHSSGETVVSNAADQSRAMLAMHEAAQGEAPGAQVISKVVPFAHVQNLRSSLGEAAAAADAKGANREAAALRQMVADVDTRVKAVAGGNGGPGENFPPDIVAQWEKAIALHADKMDRFHTGPQSLMFQRGGDGLPAAQGAELAPKFFNPRGSQSSDIAAFQKVANPETTAALKNYAITDAANQTDRLGRLTNAKFANWVNARSGAIDGLMSPGERAQLMGVQSDLARADTATSLGMATGSNTAQNVQNALGLGLLDHKAVNVLANRIPFIGKFTGPMLDGLRATAKQGKVERLGGLLADPDEMVKALKLLEMQSAPRPIGLLHPDLGQYLLRAAPMSTSGSGRQ